MNYTIVKVYVTGATKIAMSDSQHSLDFIELAFVSIRSISYII